MKQLVYTILLLITLRFTFGERKICLTIKTSESARSIIQGTEINMSKQLLHAVNLALIIEPFGALNGKLVSFERSAEVKRTEKKCEECKNDA